MFPRGPARGSIDRRGLPLGPTGPCKLFWKQINRVCRTEQWGGNQREVPICFHCLEVNRPRENQAQLIYLAPNLSFAFELGFIFC